MRSTLALIVSMMRRLAMLSSASLSAAYRAGITKTMVIITRAGSLYTYTYVSSSLAYMTTAMDSASVYEKEMLLCR